MFTGIIQSVGQVREFTPCSDGAMLVVDTGLPQKLLNVGDSIAVDGCCQTIEEFSGSVCRFHVLKETLNRTIFGGYRVGTTVNIEPALCLGDRLGGHLVSGHIDCTGRITAIRRRAGDVAVDITRPPAAEFPIIPKGSIAISGISLTVAELSATTVTVCVIPHTWSHTALSTLSAGAKVNLEADLVGKYIASLMPGAGVASKECTAPASSVTMEMLREAGFR